MIIPKSGYVQENLHYRKRHTCMYIFYVHLLT